MDDTAAAANTSTSVVETGDAVQSTDERSRPAAADGESRPNRNHGRRFKEEIVGHSPGLNRRLLGPAALKCCSCSRKTTASNSKRIEQARRSRAQFVDDFARRAE